MIRTGGRLWIVSGRAIGLVLALGWALFGSRAVVRAGMPDGGASGRPGGARGACPTLGACLAALEALPSTGDPEAVTNDRERAIASSLRGYGKAAIPDLLRRLASTERETRRMAGYTLGEIDGLTPADLPPLLRALHAGGHGGAALAVAAIGTPEAIAALYAALKAHPEDWQLPFAVARLGHAGVPTLMEAFDCRDGTSDPSIVRAPCAPPLLAAVAGIFGKLGPEASSPRSPPLPDRTGQTPLGAAASGGDRCAGGHRTERREHRARSARDRARRSGSVRRGGRERALRDEGPGRREDPGGPADRRADRPPPAPRPGPARRRGPACREAGHRSCFATLTGGSG